MSMFGESGFDAQAPENQRESSVIPAGEYAAMMIESQKVATNAGDGHYLKTRWQIVSGEFQNRIIFKNFNLWLPPHKDKAIKIARGEFSELCRAVGVLNPKDSNELHDKPCTIKVKVRQDKSGQYDDQNDISSFKPRSGSSAAPSPHRQPATAASGGGNPWQ